MRKGDATGPAIPGFSHVRPDDAAYRSDGLRDFFAYRDLGIAAATGGRVMAHHARAIRPANGTGTGWHYHQLEFQILIVTRGWAKFIYGDTETHVAAGDVVHQPPGLVHTLFDYSDDFEYYEIVGPADFATVDVAGPA